MLKKEASKITGGLRAPGKMPEGAYSIPASACQTGQILAKVEGTPCSGCYALKNRYVMPIQKAAMERRLASLNHGSWTKAMATLIKGKKHFRWHDSGDLQSADHSGKYLKYAQARQIQCIGCRLRSVSTYPCRAPQFRQI